MPSTVRVFANPTLEALERSRLALEAEAPGVTLSTVREGGATVVVASWGASLDDPAAVDRARGILIENLGAVERPADLWRRVTTATLEALTAELAVIDADAGAFRADVTARLDRLEGILRAIAAASKITIKL